MQALSVISQTGKWLLVPCVVAFETAVLSALLACVGQALN